MGLNALFETLTVLKLAICLGQGLGSHPHLSFPVQEGLSAPNRAMCL